MAPEKFIAIGDIHGCPAQLEEILKAASAYPEHRLVFLGDYIDRGPDSDAVIEKIRNLDAVFIFGNHEGMLLRHLRERFGEFPEIYENPYINVRLSRSSLEWIRDIPVPIFQTDDYLFTHAGLNPDLSLEDQDELDYYWSLPVGDYLHLTSRYVIHGHVVCPEPEVEGNRINVNTGCGTGGPLTAVVLPEMEFLVSSPSPGHVPLDPALGRKSRFASEIAELEALFDERPASGIAGGVGVGGISGGAADGDSQLTPDDELEDLEELETVD